MIQLIGLRSFLDPKTNKEKKKHELFGLAPTLPELFLNLAKYIEQIPEDQRWNVYYTALDCVEPAKCNGALRKFKSQQAIPFDFDGIDTTKLDEYIRIFGQISNLDLTKVVQVFSGNGLQLLVFLEQPFVDSTFFETKRHQYKAICERLNEAFTAAQLPGGADSSVWSPARILRLPETENRKPKKDARLAKLLQSNLEPQPFDWALVSQIPELTVADHLAEWNDKKAPKLDNKAIFSGCDFIKWIQTQPEQVREPHFYAALSIIGRMENGRSIAHKLQEAIRDSGTDTSVASFTSAQTDSKLDAALANSGPRTCANINTHWGKCAKCPNFNKITSPVLLKSQDFIATLESGFYKYSKQGAPIPAYSDLLKYFEQKTHFKTLDQNGLVFGWNGTHYTEYTPTMIKHFALRNFKPLPKQAYVNEFLNLVSEENLVTSEFFLNNDGFINVKNGVLNVEKRTLSPHDPARGFRYVLPYDFDPLAKAPRFNQFLDEITGGDKTLRAILEEFGGWALSGDDYWIHKCLLLVGEGKNGKSKFINALRYVAGLSNIGAMSLEALISSQNNRQLLEGKLFNIASEMSHKDMRDTDMFKRLTEGAVIDVKKMYYQPYLMENRAKFIFACNTLPASTDQSYGFLRRMLIVPFDQTFEGAADDPFIDKKFKQELPGIFNIFLEGYARLKAQGQFTESKRSIVAHEEYAEENNPVSEFLFECEDVWVNPLNGKCTCVKLKDLYEAFVDWNTVGEARDKKVGNLSMAAFSKALRRALPQGKDRITRLQPSKKWRHRVVFDVELTMNGGEKTFLHEDGKVPVLRGSESIKI